MGVISESRAPNNSVEYQLGLFNFKYHLKPIEKSIILKAITYFNNLKEPCILIDLNSNKKNDRKNPTPKNSPCNNSQWVAKGSRHQIKPQPITLTFPNSKIMSNITENVSTFQHHNNHLRQGIYCDQLYNAPSYTSNHLPSIRLLVWLVTNYVKSFPVIYEAPPHIKSELGIQYINIALEYKAAVEFYHRPLFDAFRRGNNIVEYIDAIGLLRDAKRAEKVAKMSIDERQYHSSLSEPPSSFQQAKEMADAFNLDFSQYIFVTTIGQLNFIMWATNIGVIKYCSENCIAIKKHQQITKNNLKTTNKSKSKTTKKSKTSNTIHNPQYTFSPPWLNEPSLQEQVHRPPPIRPTTILSKTTTCKTIANMYNNISNKKPSSVVHDNMCHEKKMMTTHHPPCQTVMTKYFHPQNLSEQNLSEENLLICQSGSIPVIKMGIGNHNRTTKTNETRINNKQNKCGKHQKNITNGKRVNKVNNSTSKSIHSSHSTTTQSNRMRHNLGITTTNDSHITSTKMLERSKLAETLGMTLLLPNGLVF